ncbi:MAG TPA: hypothetical protein VHS09_07745, partial [Polyangiaceae bacterium]|nr:hypothetical protein [Polyangiaceae bacterium]
MRAWTGAAVVASSAASVFLGCSSGSNGGGPGSADASASDAPGPDTAPGGDSGADVTTLPEAASDAGADVVAAPLLVQLSVSGATPGLGLVPPFLPAVHDYYVRCAAGTNDLTVTMTASDGAKA